MDTTDKEVAMHEGHGSGRPLPHRALALAGRVIDRIRAEHIGAQLVASNDAAGGEFNGQTMARSNGPATGNPLGNQGRLNAKEKRESALAPALVDGFLNGLSGHMTTDDSDAIG